MLRDILGLCWEVILCLPKVHLIAGDLFCYAILGNLGMATGEDDEPLENILPADEAERLLTWTGYEEWVQSGQWGVL